MSAAVSLRLPSTTKFGKTEVYAPFCPDCQSDGATAWKKLPLLAAIVAETFSSWEAEAWCHHCEHEIHITREVAFQAREPERLEKRLAELKAGAR